MKLITRLFRKNVKAGSYVIYLPKNEPGIVKRMTSLNHAFVWYHSGCTAAGTSTRHLKVISELKFRQMKDASNVHTGCKECTKWHSE